MKVLNLDLFKTSLAQYASARKIEEIFSQVDKVFNDRGAIAFSVPVSAFHPNYLDIEIVCGKGVFVDYVADKQNVLNCINNVLKDGHFNNWFGGWMVADGTHFMTQHAHLKSEVPTEEVFIFIPEIPALSLDAVLAQI